MQQREKRGAKREKSSLWPNGQVYYTFDSSVVSSKQVLIRQAMDTIEELTCLQFSPYTNQRNYIYFRSLDSDGCNSQVGIKGHPGSQRISLGPRCYTQKIILHEICHALGMWHEHNRPDRDEYIEILEENIKDGGQRNFLKRNKFEVDSQGTEYDFASAMHYIMFAFRKNRGLNTIRIIDHETYQRQGSPRVGFVQTLSKLDITQLNRLYNCPGSGIPGTLVVRIKKAENLLASQNFYVKVTAYDDNGQSNTQMTHHIRGDVISDWSTDLDFGKRVSWQYIDVSIWDYDSKIEITSSQSFSVNPGLHNREHCDNVNCNIRLNFSISLSDDCHCFSGGSCLTDGTCLCTVGYGGPRCEYFRGRLRFFARKASNLVDKDPAAASKSDPYLEVQAYSHHGKIVTNHTSVVNDNLNPVWNEELDFGVNEWAWFTVQAHDEDTTRDAKLSDSYTYTLPSFVSVQKQEMAANQGGIISFDYFFEP